MPRILTKRKEKWVKSRKPSVVRGGVLNNPTLLEEKFAAKLDALVARMCDGVMKDIRRLFDTKTAEQYFAQDASVSSQARILTNALMKKYNQYFSHMSDILAEQQVGAVDKASSASMHESLQQLSGGLSLPTQAISGNMLEVVNASTVEMVSLIKSISMEYLSGVQGAVMRSITTGRGLQDLVPYLEKHEGITKRRARMIARDQTRKAYSSLNRGRMEKAGLRFFEWRHTGGSNHPRPLHQSYNGKIFSLDDPPIIDENTGERGLPAQAINCRCRAIPVLKFDD
jgi:SPP1 gp7 family putative phage head morphogenesis protein